MQILGDLILQLPSLSPCATPLHQCALWEEPNATPRRASTRRMSFIHDSFKLHRFMALLLFQHLYRTPIVRGTMLLTEEAQRLLKVDGNVGG